ncbi:MAG: type 1 glutamine amidotransferase domain-containing protein [Rhodospirillaceae bacterium]|nr:MAG: type 1 glutamine amidotransferase domain-containing protein [Rhodospirillaceae bacterium]
MPAKVLIVLTSHDRLGDTGNKTGYWKEEFATPYYALIDAGVDVTLATPKGGEAPLDPNSEAPDFATNATVRLDKDQKTQESLKNTVRLDEVNQSDFDAVFYPGGHGPLWDLADDQNSIKLIESFHEAGKPIATVCHASAALIKARGKDGEPLVRDKSITGFTNSEEAAVGLTEVVPFLLEDELQRVGGKFQKDGDFIPHVVQDGLLITGQNPASSGPVAEALLKVLNAA